ncbi:multicopper oxidase family protein [Frigoriglobus tundricola]|uniref:Plastocyanin-like domain-containing protein n=1 Tax=Frigoriglobus tundricola TaxID=2774151 RepID=A0A6M5Z0D1_9BACT|nr:multicopper oxidase domain-containing protein [Frigoriglobus tundricola]QJW99090.1 hypothetical protein FTUN_6688 [Frigoriglobus tundricola]
MPVSARVDEIRKRLIFTDGMRPITSERLDQLPGPGAHSVRVHMRGTKCKLHKDLDATELWAYDGLYPGKFFFVRHDQTISVEWVNEIDGPLPVTVVASGYFPVRPEYGLPENEPGAFDGGTGPSGGTTAPSPCTPVPDVSGLPAWTVVHLHGARVAPDSDGWTENAFLRRAPAPAGPTQSASQRSLYPPQPRSMMLWYHDHAYTITRLNVFAGLAGGWIVRGPEEAGLNLPAGEFELPLIIQDRNFDTDADGCLTGRLLHKAETDSSKFVPSDAQPVPSDTAEFFGPFTLVNGSLWPSLGVKPQPYRLRVLNGSNARTYQLFLVDDTNTVRNELVRQIGTDAGFLGAAVPVSSLMYPASDPAFPRGPKGLILAPAERADLVVDFQCAPGRTFRWINVAVAPFDGIPTTVDPTGPFDGAQQAQLMTDRLPFPEVVQFVVASGPVGPPLDLSGLPKFERWTHESPALHGHRHRWLGLNEKVIGSDLRDGYLFFNELIELEPEDPAPADFTITLAEDSTTHRLRNRPVFFRSPINFYPEAGRPEIWHIVNFSADTHPIHLHLVDFQILSRHLYKAAGVNAVADVTDPRFKMVDSTDPATGLFPAPGPAAPPVIVPNTARANDPHNPSGVDANETGWKDVVRVNPNEIVTIAMIFEGFTGRFMYHCHILEHEDMDMMRPMVVAPAAVKPFIDGMQMMAGDAPDGPASNMAGM